jgi:AmmeMemoRadiSam system protein A
VIERLSDDARRNLVRSARATLDALVRGTPVPPPLRGNPYDELTAAFVTIRVEGSLRGCVGDISFRMPLGEAVVDMTRAAASSDPRFPPVTTRELPNIEIEISILTPFRSASPDEIDPGRHGVVVRKGERSGLLLPQVAVEFGCDSASFLELAYRKAGLPYWGRHDPSVHLEIFEADVFAE